MQQAKHRDCKELKVRGGRQQWLKGATDADDARPNPQSPIPQSPIPQSPIPRNPMMRWRMEGPMMRWYHQGEYPLLLKSKM